MTNKLVVIINSLKVPKIKNMLLYEMIFLVRNCTCLQNPWLGGHCPQIPVVHPQLNFFKPHSPPPNKIPAYATVYYSTLQCEASRNRLKAAIWRQGRGVSSSDLCLQQDNARPHTVRHTVKQINVFIIAAITPSAIFTRFGTQRFSPLLTPKRRSTWTLLHIGWGGKGGGAWLAGTAT